MLDALKAMVLKSSPTVTPAEQALEVIEQGQRDRANRQQAEADAEAGAAHQQRQAQYRHLQGEATALVSTYTEVAAAFDTKLAELATTLAEMSTLTRQIEERRSQLWALSRTLHEADIGVDFRPREWGIQVMNALRQAWSRGQHGT